MFIDYYRLFIMMYLLKRAIFHGMFNKCWICGRSPEGTDSLKVHGLRYDLMAVMAATPKRIFNGPNKYTIHSSFNIFNLSSTFRYCRSKSLEEDFPWFFQHLSRIVHDFPSDHGHFIHVSRHETRQGPSMWPEPGLRRARTGPRWSRTVGRTAALRQARPRLTSAGTSWAVVGSGGHVMAGVIWYGGFQLVMAVPQ